MIDDLFAFAQMDLINYYTLYDFFEYLTNETEYLPWRAAFKGFESITKRFKDDDLVQNFIFKILDVVRSKMEFENSFDSVMDVYKRNLFLKMLCKYKHKDCHN